MEELREKIAREMFNVLDPALEWEKESARYRALKLSEAVAALRAIEAAGYEITKKNNRQYYCWNSACSATAQDQPDCICWHDQGTGPLAHGSPMIWRTKKLDEPRG